MRLGKAEDLTQSEPEPKLNKESKSRKPSQGKDQHVVYQNEKRKGRLDLKPPPH